MKIQNLLGWSLIVIGIGCSSTHRKNANSNGRVPAGNVGGFTYDARRGSPAEYDPGAPKDSKWLELYGSVPNYRSLGQKIIGGPKEKFRWQFGPMWYRGRLGQNQVKTFIVGQEGAQDENISNRAFTGSTGTRTQKFLNHLGIWRSYLFMNTFVYTINGQLDSKNKSFAWMEQGLTSPIVEYRHKLFDYMIEQNAETVSLFMGVGAGGQSSLATWVESRGGKCSAAYELKNCDTSGMVEFFNKKWENEGKDLKVKNKILVIGVPHPGGANPNLGGDEALQNIKRGFSAAAKRVVEFKKENSGWLQPDEEEKKFGEKFYGTYPDRLEKDYEYKGYAPIPFCDFAFGTNWRMGSEGTTSNRWDAGSIQVYSDVGTYGSQNSKYEYPIDIDSGFAVPNKLLKGMHPEDLPYEPPRFYANDVNHAKSYDYGPCGFQDFTKEACPLAEMLMDWPSFESLPAQPVSHKSFGHGPIYRGRLNEAKILVLADQESHDDFFAARALTGTDGQRLQTFFNAAGVGLSYGIIRTLPVDTLGMKEDDVLKIAMDSTIQKTRQNIMDEVTKNSNTQVFITFGPIAKKVAESLTLPDKILKLDLPATKSASHVAKWEEAAQEIIKKLNSTPTDKYKGQLTTIAREDLPYHTRWWMGSSGTRSSRGEGDIVGSYYRVFSPRWQNSLPSKPLSPTEISEIESLMKKLN